MIKTLLQQKLGTKLTTEQFAVLAEDVTRDIKANNVGYKKHTSLNDLLEVSNILYQILRRIPDVTKTS